VLYDAWISKGGGERQIVLERDEPLAEGDTFEHERDSYRVVRIHPGHHDFAALITGEWIGEVVGCSDGSVSLGCVGRSRGSGS
jgi:hypothetical protein